MPSSTDRGPGGVPIPSDLRAYIERAQGLGRMVFMNMTAAAIGSRMMRESMWSPEENGLGSLDGHLVVPECRDDGSLDAMMVYFLSSTEPSHALSWSRVAVRAGGNQFFEYTSGPVPLPSKAYALALARKAALKAAGSRSQTYDPIVLARPSIDHDGIIVYLMTRSSQADVVVLGQHHRVFVSQDGTTVTKLEALSRGIQELPLPSRGSNGSTGGLLRVTHDSSETPTEVHVLASCLHKLPIEVETARGYWLVTGPAIAFQGRRVS